MNNKNKSITKSQYYTLVGLREVAKKNWIILEELEKAAQDIIKEENSLSGGHTSDFIHGSRELNDVLEILEIEVKE